MATLDKLIATIAYCVDPDKETDSYNECLYEKCKYAEVSKELEDGCGRLCMDCLLRDALEKLEEDQKEIEKLQKDRFEIGKLVLRLSGIEDN